MANTKLVYGSSTETAWNSTGRITSPSLILVDGGTTRYTPLFSGSAGGTATSGDYRYTLGHLIGGSGRVALSQEQYKTTFTIKGNCSVEVSTSTYTTTSGSGTSATTTTHYVKSYNFAMGLWGGTSWISYVTTNLVRLSPNGSGYYFGSWSEESTSGYPATRDTVFAIQTNSPINGYSISNSYQNVASGSNSWSANWTMYLNGSR